MHLPTQLSLHVLKGVWVELTSLFFAPPFKERKCLVTDMESSASFLLCHEEPHRHHPLFRSLCSLMFCLFWLVLFFKSFLFRGFVYVSVRRALVMCKAQQLYLLTGAIHSTAWGVQLKNKNIMGGIFKPILFKERRWNTRERSGYLGNWFSPVPPRRPREVTPRGTFSSNRLCANYYKAAFSFTEQH